MKVDITKPTKKKKQTLRIEFDDQKDLEAFLRTVSYARFHIEAQQKQGVEVRYLERLENFILEQNDEAKEMLMQFFGID